MASEKITAMIEELKTLTVLELSELVKAVEEEFGVSAAAAVAVAAPAAGGAAAAEEKTEFDVILKDAGAEFVKVDNQSSISWFYRNMGTVGEMAEAPRAEGFTWGMTALPAAKEGGDRYSYTWFEQAWIPSGAENIDAAKQFVAFLYSDKACEIFANAKTDCSLQ